MQLALRWMTALSLLLATPVFAGAGKGRGHECGPPEHSAAPRVSRVALETGVELEVYSQGRAHGEPIIFLHGYTDTWHSFDLNYRHIPRSYRVYGLTQRGHGDSDKPATGYAQSDFVADVVAFMDAKGIARANIVGHSMGSLIAHKFAAEHPDRVKKLVLIGSGPTAAGNPVVDWLLDVVSTLTDPVDPDFVTEFQSSTFVRPVPASYLDRMISESQKVPVSVWNEAGASMAVEDHVAELANITAKTLIVWGDQDGFFTQADQDGLVQAIPQTTLKIYAGTGHAPHAEEPGRFMSDLLRFLR